ncbi:LysR family transcriptional regulator [Sphingomonas sp.]|uniref:LysR family transcriptional regulator n=1 Tax=Sphingomonas sp. TaxID=28214 RepID=UPI001DB5F389|nr:LysR family transcriptional regulator [Sphingomonas sp.]MBX9797453.1 LysR family transcriptional regulator [Sphingomonas sp.]
MNFDWNDLRYLIAVADTGSTAMAARALRVNATTVARRLAMLEQALGLTLFDRSQGGYALSEAGAALLDQARGVASSTAAFAAAAEARRRETGGTVKLTTSELYAVTILVPILRDLTDRYPEISVELDTSDAIRDLAAGEADIALRSLERLEGAGLVGRRVVSEQWAFYASRSYAEAHGLPGDVVQLGTHTIIGGGGDGLWQEYSAGLAAYGIRDAVKMVQGSVLGLLAAVKGGLGVAILPAWVADQDPDLLRCPIPIETEDRGLWLVAHERLRNTPRVRAVLDFLAEWLLALRRN